MTLHICVDGEGAIDLPLDTVTSTLIIYGGKGMGKTNMGSVAVEEMSANGLRWSFLDPMGVAWGLRHSADGRGAGVRCVILGGVHGDIPIEPTGGAVVADFVVDETENVIIDFSRKANGDMWTNEERVHFVTTYIKRLFSRQGSLVAGARRAPIFQILDEAARYIPQTIPAGNKELSHCLAAWEQVAEEGRNVGIGVCFLTQRSARINKSVAELADAMFAFRTVGPNSVEAVTDWLGSHVPKSRVDLYVGKVRELPVGSALLVSPGWLKKEGIVAIRPRRTFDSSATPKPGEAQRRVIGAGAKPDLDTYRKRMADTIERAKQEDPKALRSKIGDLEKLLSEARRHSEENDGGEYARGHDDGYALGVADTRRAEIDGMRSVRDHIDEWMGDVARLTEGFNFVSGQLGTAIDKASGPPALQARRRPPEPPTPRPANPVEPAPERPAVLAGDLPPVLLRVVNALNALHVMGIPEPTRQNLAKWLGVSADTGSFRNNLGALRTAGLIAYPSDNRVKLEPRTAARYAEPFSPARTMEDRVRVWGQHLEPVELRMLVTIMRLGECSRGRLATELRVSAETGSFRNNLGALRSLGLIDYPKDGWVEPTSLILHGH